MQIATTIDVEFAAEATERDFLLLREGQSAQGELIDGKVPFEGTIRARGTAIDPGTGLASMRIALIAPTGEVPLGAYGRVRIAASHRDGVLLIPLEALRGAVSDGASVAICKDGHAELRSIRTGWRGDKSVEVLDGLRQGERVAVDHVLGLDNATPLREAK